ncbi:MAG: hypothetical protein WA252_19955 [Candidatus Sulfotelmatobacter sp.]
MHSHLPHWIGLGGEVLNFAGACILALDLLRRPRERKEFNNLRQLRGLGQEFALKRTVYKGIPISCDDFEAAVSDLRTSRLAVVGVAIMAVGFPCLIAYHWMEIKRN